MVTFVAISSNIASTVLLYDYQSVPLFLNWLVAMVYFITTPLMGVVYFYYTFSIVFEGHPRFSRLLLLSSIPAIIYLVMVLLNPFTHWFFNIDAANGYVRGNLLILTYIVFYLYCFSCLIITLFWGRHLERSIRNILASFPIVAGIAIIVQQFFPEFILSGSAATCALLIIYLYLQNKQISLDHLTGLPNRQSFLKMLELRVERQQDEPFAVVVLSLKSFKTLNDNFGQHNGNQILRAVAAYLQSISAGNLVYRYSGDEFAILVRRIDKEFITGLITELNRRMTLVWEAGTCSTLLSCGIAVVQYPNSAQSVEGL
ncbi:MAG: GGDEF domain-containing protein, partial [Christensenella sp.]|uniref:GGDEF domain-containing protein n=1 Tax=Christensenella sp. TaxID=1935934 RepID=UPI002B1FA8AF